MSTCPVRLYECEDLLYLDSLELDIVSKSLGNALNENHQLTEEVSRQKKSKVKWGFTGGVIGLLLSLVLI